MDVPLSLGGDMADIEKYAFETGETRLLENGVRIATDTARWGLRLVSLPVQPLPAVLREGLFDSARLMVGAVALFPQLALQSLQGLTQEIDDLEARAARREDLGRRVEREVRRHQYSGLETD